MSVNAGLGVLDNGVVDHGGQDVEHHEDNGGSEAGEQQGSDGAHDQQDVDPEQLGTGQSLLSLGQLGSDIGVALQSDIAQSLLLGAAQQEGDDQNGDQTNQNGGQDGHEELGNGSFGAGHGSKSGVSTDGGAAPGQDVHGTGGQSHDGSQGGALHAQSIIQRQQSGNADQEGDSAGTVQMDDHSQDSGTDADLDGIGANQLQHLADDGTEGTGIGQDAEEQDGEDEHNAGSGNGADTLGAGDHAAQALEVGDEINNTFGGAFGDHFHEEAGDDAGDHGNSDQGNQGRGLLGHDQHQHGDDRDKAEYCERNRHNDFLLIFFAQRTLAIILCSCACADCAGSYDQLCSNFRAKYGLRSKFVQTFCFTGI